MRRFLEKMSSMPARGKGNFIGHPAFYLMVALYRKMASTADFFFGHRRRHRRRLYGRNLRPYPHAFLMSFIRGINGWVTGMVIGIGLIIAIAIVSYVTTWLGKQVAHRD